MCGPYPNRTYIFSSSEGLRKVLERVTVGRLYLPLGWRRGSRGGCWAWDDGLRGLGLGWGGVG